MCLKFSHFFKKNYAYKGLGIKLLIEAIKLETGLGFRKTFRYQPSQDQSLMEVILGS